MKPHRLPDLCKKLPLLSLRPLISFFSSSAAAENPRFSGFFCDDNEEGSTVYRHALKFQRPTTITFQHHLYNSASFIGSVASLPKLLETKNGRLGVRAVISVKDPIERNRIFGVSLLMWDKLAMISLMHVKFNDMIYISGCFGSFTKSSEDGNLMTYYEMHVKELNFIAQHDQNSTHRDKKPQLVKVGVEKQKDRLCLWQDFFNNPFEWRDQRKSKTKLSQPDFKHRVTGEALWMWEDDPPWVKKQLQELDSTMEEAGLEKQDRLCLWQVFFSNPFEWWDKRTSKTRPSQPDFKHKDTGEALWMRPDDPPWVKKQLQLFDSRKEEGIGDHLRSRSRLSMWDYDE